MNPLLQEHFDALDSAVTAVEEVGRLGIPPLPEVSVLMEQLGQLNTNLVRDLETMGAVTSEWALLEPPKEAHQFHILALEMMQLRSRGLNNVLALTLMMQAGTVQDSDFALMQSGVELIDKAERIFVDMLVEARDLGGIEIERR